MHFEPGQQEKKHHIIEIYQASYSSISPTFTGEAVQQRCCTKERSRIESWLWPSEEPGTDSELKVRFKRGIDIVEQFVDAPVANQPLKGGGDRLQGKCAGLGSATGQDRVYADVGAHVKEAITGAKKMKHKGHVGHIVQTAIKAHGRARHPGFFVQGGGINPGHDHRHAQQPTAQLPTQEAGHGAGEVAASEGVTQPVTEQRCHLCQGT